MAGRVRIGTSGWHYKHWLGPFYPADLPTSEMLNFYLRFFDTVEINNSFYKLPDAKTFETWRESVPESFLFAVKANRYLTHMKKLKDPHAGLENFIPRAELLGNKLGPILFQLPPRWRVNLERLNAFLEALPRGHQYSFELRNASWHTEEVYHLLRQHNAAFCVFEIGGFHSPIEVTADFAYIRLHGPTEHAYQGSYNSETLQSLAVMIHEWRQYLKDIYVYFDNDQAAFAAHNALELKSYLESQ